MGVVSIVTKDRQDMGSRGWKLFGDYVQIMARRNGDPLRLKFRVHLDDFSSHGRTIYTARIVVFLVPFCREGLHKSSQRIPSYENNLGQP